jgi:hypothetical protein
VESFQVTLPPTLRIKAIGHLTGASWQPQKRASARDLTL